MLINGFQENQIDINLEELPDVRVNTHVQGAWMSNPRRYITGSLEYTIDIKCHYHDILEKFWDAFYSSSPLIVGWRGCKLEAWVQNLETTTEPASSMLATYISLSARPYDET